MDVHDRHSSSSDTATATGYISYLDGRPTEAGSIQQLAAAANAAYAAGAETHWLRARTADGERRLTRPEQLEVLVEMEQQIKARDRSALQRSSAGE